MRAAVTAAGMSIVLALLIVGSVLTLAPVKVSASTVGHPGSPAATSGTFRPAEDSPRWNCITMGNRRCGAGWTKPTPAVDQYLVDEGHAHCIWLVGPTTRVACSDGYVTTS